jgi:hypothetical protein
MVEEVAAMPRSYRAIRAERNRQTRAIALPVTNGYATPAPATHFE